MPSLQALPYPFDFRGRRAVVMGLGAFGGGLGAAKWLAQQGARVLVTDTSPAKKLAEPMAKLADLPIEYRLGEHRETDFAQADLVVVNPAVAWMTSPYVQAAITAGVPLTTEINLLIQRLTCPVIGITGSVGKSTTTALIHAALTAGLAHQTGRKVWLGGNIGRSLLDDLPQIAADHIAVLELSSFMLEMIAWLHWSPQVAVVTNLVPNHLDRHGGMVEYAAAKQFILRYQRAEDVAFLNGDDAEVATWGQYTPAQKQFWHLTGETFPMEMPGQHNQSNARAALAVLATVPGVNMTAAATAISTYPGLPHRLQRVHTHTLNGRKVGFYNDSKATTCESSLTAVEAFASGTAIFIVGGYDKHIDLSPFSRALGEHAAAVLTIGATGPMLAEQIRAANPQAVVHEAENLPNACAQLATLLRQLPQATEVVLSPACASWGQFVNYEKRGELFTQLVQAIT